MNPWDFKPLESVFGYKMQIAPLEPHDVVIFRIPKDSPSYLLEQAMKTVERILPPDVKALFVPEDWEIAVARPSSTQDTIDGLKEIREDLRGAA